MNIKTLFLLLLENRQAHRSSADTARLMPPGTILLRPLGNAVGDAAVHTAHLAQLKAAFPQAKIGVIVTPQNKPVFEHCGLVDEYVERRFFHYVKNYKKWDWLLDFENNFNSASLFMDRILMPKTIIIFRKYCKKYYHFDSVKSYDLHCPQKDDTPLSHYLSHSLLNDRFHFPPPAAVLHVDDATRQKIQPLWAADKVRILLCPQGSKRQLPETELADLLNAVLSPDIKQWATQVDLLIGYTPTAEKYRQKLIALCPDLPIHLSPPTTLSEYLALIDRADLVLAVDGGSLHLACALKKPLLSFFADSQPNLGTWTPLISPNVPHLRLVSRTPRNSNDTQDFPLDKAIPWLRQQIQARLPRTCLPSR